VAEGHSRFIASMIKAAMLGRSNQFRSIPSVAPFSSARCIDLAHTLWPAMLAHQREALGVVDQARKVD